MRLIACTVLLLVACDAQWARSIASTAEEDVAAILVAARVPASGVACTSPTPPVRAARCTFMLDAKSHAALVAKLTLRPRSLVEPNYGDERLACARPPTARRDALFGQLPSLGLQLRQPYSRFDLMWDPHSGAACVEVHIAYG